MPLAASQIPTTEGDQWLTLALAQDAPSYSGTSHTWFSLSSTVHLNLADRPDAGEGTVIES